MTNLFTEFNDDLVEINCDCCGAFLGMAEAAEEENIIKNLQFCNDPDCGIHGCTTDRLENVENPSISVIKELQSLDTNKNVDWYAGVISPSGENAEIYPNPADDNIPF